jgi:hypothetical protein
MRSGAQASELDSSSSLRNQDGDVDALKRAPLFMAAMGAGACHILDLGKTLSAHEHAHAPMGAER